MSSIDNIGLDVRKKTVAFCVRVFALGTRWVRKLLSEDEARQSLGPSSP
ncbi:MAG: hypothetical protein QGI33_07290 [Candidatus Brocadiia bacterium]|nr:hypothetical protein [Candidatus Brocadiia bacterium]